MRDERKLQEAAEVECKNQNAAYVVVLIEEGHLSVAQAGLERTVSQSVAQTDLKLTVVLTQALNFW